MRHTFEAHSSEPSFSFTCGINGCTSSFKLFSSFSSHLNRKHSAHLEPPDSDHCNDENMSIVANSHTTNSNSTSVASSYDIDDINVNDHTFEGPNETQLAGGAKRSAALFLRKDTD